MKYYTLNKENLCFAENIVHDTDPKTYSKVEVGDKLTGIFNDAFTTSKEITNKKGARITLKQIHLKFLEVKGEKVLIDKPITFSLFFEQLTYFTMNSLAATEPDEPVTLSVYESGSSKRYVNVGVDQYGEHVMGLHEYDSLPKADKITKKDGSFLYDDTEVIVFWKKFIKSDLRKAMSTKYKPAKRERTGKKQDDDEDEDDDIPAATSKVSSERREPIDELPF